MASRPPRARTSEPSTHDSSRWTAPSIIRDLIATELHAARNTDEPWAHLERAHIASQPWAWPHTRVHAAMLAIAIRQRDRREALGQVVRLVVAGPGSLSGRNPAGNTGRSTMPLTETAPVPGDLRDLLDQATAVDASSTDR